MNKLSLNFLSKQVMLLKLNRQQRLFSSKIKMDACTNSGMSFNSQIKFKFVKKDNPFTAST